jgi:hypothetical protein
MTFTTLATVIFAVCQAVNIALPDRFKKFIPLVAVVLGSATAFFGDGDYITAITAALTAIGFHSGAKNTAEIKLFANKEVE